MATIVAEEPVTSGPPAAGERDDADSGARRSARIWPLALGLTLLTIVTYANSLRAPYLFDDKYFFERDSTYNSVERALASPMSRRLGIVTFALDHRAHGRSPIGCHFVNVTIHLAAGLLLFGLVRRTLGLHGVAEQMSSRADILAGICAAIWLVHPLQTSAVTYVIQRFESLMGLWFLLALYGLLRGATARRAWPWYLLSLAAAWLGVQTKEVMAVLPIVAVAYDRIYLCRDWRELFVRRWWLHLGFIACASWLVYEIRWAFDPNLKASAGLGTSGVSSWEYLRSQNGVILHYLRLTFWPDYLCLDYRWPIAQTAAEIYLPGALIVALLILCGWGLWRHPKVGFLGMTFFAILAPTSSVMPIADLAFEHRMYLPLAVVVVLAVIAVIRLMDQTSTPHRRLTWTAAGVTLAILIALSARTIVRNGDYQDAIRMWTSVIRARPENERAYNQLAISYEAAGRLDDAEVAYKKTLELRPDAHAAEVGLGTVSMRRGAYDDARQYFQKALASKHVKPIALANLASLEAKLGNHQSSVEFFRQAVAADPNNVPLRIAYANACKRTGEIAEAVRQYKEVTSLDGTSDDALRQLIEILATSADVRVRNAPEAIRLARRLERLTGGRSAVDLDIVATAYAAAGHFDDAMATVERALRLPADSETRTRLRKRLKVYQRGEAVFEPFDDDVR